VAPGTVDIGGGYVLDLTPRSVTLAGDGGSVGPDYTDTGNQPAGSANLMLSGRAVASLYIGSPEAASATFTVDGTARPGTVLTLAGHPGWSVAYLVLPAGSADVAMSVVSVVVHDASGRPVALFAAPTTSGGQGLP
jgi:hypothetical protein